MRSDNKVTISRLLEYLFVIGIILNCNTVYSASIVDFHLNEIIAILSVLLVVIRLSTQKVSKRLLTRWASVFAIYYLLMIAYLIVSVPHESIVGFVSRFMVFIPFTAYYLSSLGDIGDRNRVLRAFVSVMVFLSVLSVIFWFTGSFLHILKPNMSIQAHWGRDYTYPGYFGVYFERQTLNLFSYTGYRNDGIFAEGPMYSLCLLIAIAEIPFIENIDTKRDRAAKRKLAILIITLITVMSFSGIAMLTAFIFIRFLTSSSRNKSSKGYRLIAAMFVLLIGGFIVAALLEQKQQTSSWLIRLDDIQAGFNAWLAAPLFGNGYGSYAVEQYMSSFRWWNTGFSSAFLSVLSQGGIVLFSVYFFAFYNGFRSAIKERRKEVAIFVGIVLVEFFITLFHYTFLLLFLLAFCYSLYITRDKSYPKHSLQHNMRVKGVS